MLVSDIFEDSKEVLGFCSDAKTFSRLTDAVETLSNKGQWDSLLTYLNIATTGDNTIIAMPETVDAILRLNINNDPAFVRDRMWEFTLNGPGSNDPRIGFQWEDLGDYNTNIFLPGDINPDFPQGFQIEAELPGIILQPPHMLPKGGYGLEFPLTTTIIVSDRNPDAFAIYTLDGSEPTWTHGAHGGRNTRITITSETTIRAITALNAHDVSVITTEFYTDEPPPLPPPPPFPPPVSGHGQRIIRISQPAVSVIALVRMRPVPISSLSDWIPLDSKMAILLMLKALECYRRGTPDDFKLGQAQEAQALQFLKEEHQSRNAFSDLSKQMDSPPMVGYSYHANNLVIVSDIYDEASAICGGVGENHVYDRISEAVEVLSNKGQWDGLTAYLDMAPSGDVVGLPRQVEIPVKINIESRPTVSRSRLFEFSINGPGTNLDEVTTLTWEDQGETNLMIPLKVPSTISFSGTTADGGKIVTVYGVDVNDTEQTIEYIIPYNDQEQSHPVTWKTITRISKVITLGPVNIHAGGMLVGLMYPDEQEALYRSIKLNKPADNIKIMFRKASLKVTSQGDIIPLKSRSAVLLMLRALQIYKMPNLAPESLALAQQLENQSLKFLQEEEQSRLQYIQASSKDQLPALGVNDYSRGVVLLSDVYDDAADIFGPIGRQRIFEKITESMEMLANKSQWDGLDGYVDIITDQRGYLTLPRKVEQIIGMNFFRHPAQMRNKWYEFHMNGLGTDPVMGNYFDDLGSYPIVTEPTQALNLFAVTNIHTDENILVRAYGYNLLGQWIRSIEDGEWVDGEIVPMNVIVPTSVTNQQIYSTSSFFRQISRITKEQSSSAISLHATSNLVLPGPFNIHNPLIQFLAMYDADETEPLFKRIRVPLWVTWARIRYRSSTMNLTRMSDPLNMKSKTALVTMMRSLKSLEAGQIDIANGFEQKAVQLISEEQMSRNPDETFDLQYDQRTSWSDPLQGQF